jgi:hypothetical protein
VGLVLSVKVPHVEKEVFDLLDQPDVIRNDIHARRLDLARRTEEREMLVLAAPSASVFVLLYQ